MAIDVLFAVRGLLAFVAFTEWTNALRCVFFEPAYPLDKLFTGLEAPQPANPDLIRVLAHLYALFSLLNGLILAHLAVYAHYRPLVSLALSSVVVKLVWLLAHIGIWPTIRPSPELLFPVVSCGVTLTGVILVPWATGDTPLWVAGDDENRELLRTMNLPKNRSHRR
ncbi:uncharacterized protein LOC131889024 [Tigriopus californicus]|uniref:uncharacterized protein LOC131889024 n=1 Tax=Tigriopus californicus TaxID=6832 RepID=UPI0027DA88C3|nr:uncharacterized protein LOC131889024 [Tigriopus californicus]